MCCSVCVAACVAARVAACVAVCGNELTFASYWITEDLRVSVHSRLQCVPVSVLQCVS